MRYIISSPLRLVGVAFLLTGLCGPLLASNISVSLQNPKASFAIMPLASVAPSLPANTLTVTNTNDSGTGSLREAIATAQPNDTINFNLNNCPCTITLASELVINKSLIIQGPGAEQLTVSGNNVVRVFNIAAGNLNVTLSGIKIANGKGATSGGGGGIFNASTGTVNVTNSTLSGNFSADPNCCSGGGGIFNSNTGTVNITNSTLSGNTNPSTGRYGGGVYNTKGTVNIINSTLSGNTAAESAGGGAIFNANGTVTIINSTLSGNVATQGSTGSSGGGIYNVAGGTVTVIGSLLSSNSGKEGGAIFNSQAAVIVINSTLSGNSNIGSGRGGGAIFNNGSGSTVTVTNCTISGNSGKDSGGGIFNASNGTLNVKNTIIALNSATTSGPDVSGNFNSQGYNLVGKAVGSTGFTIGVNNDLVGSIATPINPMLGPLANNGGPTQTMTLLSGSPALDRGSAANDSTGTSITTDQRGLPRPVDLSSVQNAAGGNGSDIGAYEAQSAPVSQGSRPLIFIPGIAGSRLIRASDGNERWPGIWTFHDGLTLDTEDPARITDIVPGGAIRSVTAIGETVQFYGPLLDRLIGAGYRIDGNTPTLFVFAYDWRKSNAENADALRSLIDNVRSLYPGSNVDIVAHSMGGILAQRYILKSPSGAHHVAKLITIGTPWLGAPKLINTLETGQFFEGKQKIIARASTLKKLVEFFPGAHELIPSPRYFELGGTPFRESGWDINNDGISIQNYTFTQMFQFLNQRHPRSSPATNGLQFHDGVVGQDGWLDGVDGTGVQYYHFYGMRSGADTIGTVVAARTQVCTLSGICNPISYFNVLPTLGDGTVPLISARRSGNGINLNAAGATLKLFAYNTNANDDVEHAGLAKNANVLNALVEALNSPLAPAFSEQMARSTDDKALAVPPEPNAQPNYYVKLLGVESVTLTDSHGKTQTPLSGEPEAGIPDVTVYTVGGKSVFMILPQTDTFDLVFAAGNTPVALEIRTGTDIETSQVVRYADLNLPTGVKAKLQITPQGIGVLHYDTDGDGNYETSVTPTVSITGTAAQDTDAPTVSIGATAQGNSSTITITSSDPGSGVKVTYFSLNGINFQPYTAPFTVNRYQAPTIYAFSDDNVGNRSGLVTHQLINFGVPVLVTQPDSERAIALDSVLRLAEPFHLTYDHLWGSDRRTRIMLFALNFDLSSGESASAVTANAEDASGRIYSLPVEYVGKVPGSEWMTCVIVKLNDEIGDVGDVLVKISYHGISSNGVRIGIGHIGGGPPNNAGAISIFTRSSK